MLWYYIISKNIGICGGASEIQTCPYGTEYERKYEIEGINNMRETWPFIGHRIDAYSELGH